MNKFLAIIFSIILTITVFFFAFEIETFNYKNYEESYIKYDVFSTTKLNINELMEVTRELLSNLKGNTNEAYLQKYFNEKEMLHLKDVRNLFKMGFIIRYVFLTIVIVLFVYLFFETPNSIKKAINYTWVITLIMIGIFLLLIKIDFNKYFTYFHLTFFDNDLWLLDPNTDLMLQMMPEPFFINIFKKILLLFIVLMSIIVIIANISEERMVSKIGNKYFE